jgi:hypothetical protein
MNPETFDDFGAWAQAADAWLGQAVELGLGEEEFARLIEESPCSLRVVQRDGHAMVGTADVNRFRVNICVEHGKVTSAYRG